MALNNTHLPSGDQYESASATPTRGDAELLAGAEFLPCGRPLGRAWEQVRAPTGTADPHSSHCPYCREAIEGLTALGRATRSLRARGTTRWPSPGQPRHQRGPRRGAAGHHAHPERPPHELCIAESAAAKALRRAADTVPGALATSCRLTSSKGGHAVHAVAITVAAMLDKPLPERADAVRQATST
jgi:hypothetical protein